MKRENPIPPKSAERFLSWVCKGELLEEILGDLYEYHVELLDQPNWKRKLIYWFHIFHFLRPSLLKKLSGTQNLNNYGMLKLLFKTSTRALAKNKLVSVMSMFTLVVGAMSFLLVYSWIENELSMDSFHSKKDKIHIALSKFNEKSDFTPIGPGIFFRLDYSQLPEVEKVMVVHTYDENQIKVRSGDATFPGRAWVADSTFFDFFDFKLLEGTKNVLYEPTNIVVTKEFAERLFQSEDPIGKMVEVKCDQTGVYQIAGIMEDIPANSSINIDFLVPRHSKDFWRRLPTDLLLVGDNFDRDDFNDKFSTMGRVRERHAESIMSTLPFNTAYFNRPIEIPLFFKYGDRTNLRVMQMIAAIILIVTVLSFANLQTTLQLTMAEKIGIKKAIGASKSNLGFEILINRLMYFVTGLVISFLIYQMVFPYYIHWMELDLDARPLFDIQVLSIVLGFVVGVSLVISLSKILRINAMEALAGRVNLLRVPMTQRILTTLQYSITVILLIATSVVFLQLKFMLNKDTGLIQNNIVETDFFDIFPAVRQDSIKREEMLQRHEYVLSQLKANPDIVAVSQGLIPINMAYTQAWKLAGGSDEYESMHMMSIDSHYDELFGLKVTEGQFFADSLASNEQVVVINESARKFLNIKNIHDATLIIRDPRGDAHYSIIGVVDDFHFEHLSHSIKPLILRDFSNADRNFIVRFKEGSRARTIDFLDKLYREVNNDAAFTFENFEDKVDAQYANEKRMANIIEGFAVVALLLATSGLFTFAFHETKRRTKEIGIRKVNGASLGQVFFVMGKSFLYTILTAFLLASPIAWYLMQMWLEDFANRVEMSWWIFAAVGGVIILFALTTVSWQTLKVARTNPVESLRYE